MRHDHVRKDFEKQSDQKSRMNKASKGQEFAIEEQVLV